MPRTKQTREDQFIVGRDWADGYSAFFEQDDETGWFYVSQDHKVMHSVHIYNCRSQSPAVCEGNVAVVRSEDGTRFGVAIWKELRAIVDVNTGETTRHPKGISDENWLRGFPHHMAKDEKGCPRAFIEC